MNIAALSGLQFFQHMQDGALELPSMCRTLPMRIRTVESGRMVMEVTASREHLNALGGVHGGFSAAVLDNVAGAAVQSALDAGVALATIELGIKLLRPLQPDVTYVAEGRLVNLSKRLGVAEGSVRDEAGVLYATATCTCMVMRQGNSE
jgi:uncharacterized protein (TIGR00369 family)